MERKGYKMIDSIDPAEKACQEYWKELVEWMNTHGDWKVKPWDEIGIETKVVTKVHFWQHVSRPGAITPEAEHTAWMKTKRAAHYRSIGAIYNPEAKIHPMVEIPFSRLPWFFKVVPTIVCDIFRDHVPFAAEYNRQISI